MGLTAPGGRSIMKTTRTSTGLHGPGGPIMEHFYLVCAALGGTLLVCQFVMGLLGFGGQHEFGGGDHDLGVDHEVGGHDAHHDAAHDSSHAWFVGLLTFRTIAAALTFFGLGGWLALTREGL